MAGADLNCDVLVVGTGAAGLTAALTARFHGLQTIIIEKQPTVGGTTARSAGFLWVPCNALAARAGVVDSIAEARAYIAHEAGPYFVPELVDAFLAAAPEMVDFLGRATALRFGLGAAPDYHSDVPGARNFGRPLCAAPFDGRQLGAAVTRLAGPEPTMTFAGLTLSPGPDLRHLLNATRSPASAWYTAKRLLRYGRDRWRHGRNLHLVNGQALVAGPYRSVLDTDIRVYLQSAATELIRQHGAVAGAVVRQPDGEIRIMARHGVVLATGGFPGDLVRRRQLFPHHPAPDQHLSLAAPSAAGDGLRLAEAAGGVVESGLAQAGSWAPVSEVPLAGGARGRYFHILERGKPGVIAVRPDGRRFTNEARSYHDFGAAMIAERPAGEGAAAFLIADHRALRRYGLGFAKPFPLPLGPCLRSGYLIRGASPAGLAGAAGIDPDGLAATIAAFNHHARAGRDPQFGRGDTAYERFQGDPRHRPNPCVGPLERPPFYAVRLLPGDLGTLAALRTDAAARVTDGAGRPIGGLYAVGNDMVSIFGGAYPGGGANLGPAMTFAYLAGRHLAAGGGIRQGASPLARDP